MDDAAERGSARKVLVLGGSGMLGHKLVQTLGDAGDVAVTLRHAGFPLAALPPFHEPVLTVGGVDATEFATVAEALEKTSPDTVINCIGIVKQRDEAADPILSVSVNALFPHRLAELCGQLGARLIHISTDCVFSGRRGGLAESDTPDPVDLYGRSKLLGEVTAPDCLCLRTSIIGRELSGRHGLLEWFVGQRGTTVRGFTRAVFSGLTTRALSRVISRVVSDHGGLEGLFHVASEPISKFDLLSRINHAMDLGIQIEAVDSPAIDRSLDGSKFTNATGIRVPAWDKMISDLAGDRTPYDEWRDADGST